MATKHKVGPDGPSKDTTTRQDLPAVDATTTQGLGVSATLEGGGSQQEELSGAPARTGETQAFAPLGGGGSVTAGEKDPFDDGVAPGSWRESAPQSSKIPDLEGLVGTPPRPTSSMPKGHQRPSFGRPDGPGDQTREFVPLPSARAIPDVRDAHSVKVIAPISVVYEVEVGGVRHRGERGRTLPVLDDE